MAGGDLNITQVSTLLNTILGQARLNPAAVVDTSSFITVAQTALKTAPDVLLNALGQMFTRQDIVSIRPYARKFKSLERSSEQWGNAVRKINYVDQPMEDNVAWSLTDGESVDMYKVAKPQILQTNFYGQATWEQTWTLFDYQMDVAFSDPWNFQQFVSGIFQNKADQREQAHESLARSVVTNLIGGVALGNTADGVVKVLELYNTQTGKSLTATSVYDPANFPDFVRFFVGLLKTYYGWLSERSQKWQINITDKPITRHTPREDMMIYLYSPFFQQAKTRVYGDIFNDQYFDIGNFEEITYWQSIADPAEINVKASYLQPDGTITAGAYNAENVLGIIFDRNAAGYTTIMQRGGTTPYNTKGNYVNNTTKFSDRYYNDFTEKAVVFVLE